MHKTRLAARREQRRAEFNDLIRRYLESSEVRSMDSYIQHGNTTTLCHCRNVAWVSYILNESLHLHAERRELIAAAMLHDFYLYDWHDGDPARKIHGFTHPYTAARNAVDIFGISEKARRSIHTHMWPLNITDVPRSREAVIICLADKYCALMETIVRRRVWQP